MQWDCHKLKMKYQIIGGMQFANYEQEKNKIK